MEHLGRSKGLVWLEFGMYISKIYYELTGITLVTFLGNRTTVRDLNLRWESKILGQKYFLVLGIVFFRSHGASKLDLSKNH